MIDFGSDFLPDIPLGNGRFISGLKVHPEFGKIELP